MRNEKSLKILNQYEDKDGYLLVGLSKDGKRKKFFVHRLVAITYLDNPTKYGKLEINHKDFNRKNNHFSNLEWVTHKENIAYTKAAKRHSSDRDISGKNNPNYGNTSLKKKFVKYPELRMVQSRPGEKNGRAIPVRFWIDDIKYIDFKYIGECADYLIKNNIIQNVKMDSLRTSIRKAAESSSLYRDLRFDLI